MLNIQVLKLKKIKDIIDINKKNQINNLRVKNQILKYWNLYKIWNFVDWKITNKTKTIYDNEKLSME